MTGRGPSAPASYPSDKVHRRGGIYNHPGRSSPGKSRTRDACAAHDPRLSYNHMVAHASLSDAETDRLFHALADATRRNIVARVLAGEQASISALAARYEMSFAAVQKHVAVLEAAGLVTKQAQGRERIVRGNPERIAQARELLAQLEELWKSRFSQIDALFSETRSQE